ncbi:hypothetical protein HAX54_016072 [Datura stramonium]|uniref:ATP-dependent Clp protease proteolytic subunit n=1 Tax=Datura stramonium TaxID=4076 RepID=A0ABS8UIA7_DATST|nr:hypothetical protein [Datura stramonium]
MESLTLSTSLSPNCSSFNLRHGSLPKLSPTFSPYPSRQTSLSLKSSLTSHQPTSKTLSDSLILNPNSEKGENKKLSLLLASAPQTPSKAMRGAEGDAMGLLFRERIVFLGNEIDDFIADAIMSQLLLLDAMDSTKDIRLFINSPGGSLSPIGIRSTPSFIYESSETVYSSRAIACTTPEGCNFRSLGNGCLKHHGSDEGVLCSTQQERKCGNGTLDRSFWWTLA